ncbi:MAG: hypothetical protein NTX86_00010, partial [Candidatus Dependentiae bacterium]|nr:hypothetical protein [Candidatus Dependentiae bacterium]
SNDTKDGTWLAWNDKDVEKSGTHPVAYAARYNHRFYPKAGTYVRMFGMANDITNQGFKWMPNNLVRLYPVADKRFDKNTMGWLYFPGIYGAKDNSIQPLGLQQWFGNATWDIQAPATAPFCPNMPMRDPKNLDDSSKITQDKMDYQICLVKSIPNATVLPNSQQKELQDKLNEQLGIATKQYPYDLQKIQELLPQGADINSFYQGYTPLMRASLDNRPEFTGLYLMHGADPLVVDTNGKTAFQLAVERGANNVVNVFKNAGIWMLPNGDLGSDLINFKAQIDNMNNWVNVMINQTSCSDAIGLSKTLKNLTFALFIQNTIPKNVQLKGTSWPVDLKMWYDQLSAEFDTLRTKISQIQSRYKACDQAIIDAANKAAADAAEKTAQEKAAADKAATDKVAAQKAAAEKAAADKIAAEKAAADKAYYEETDKKAAQAKIAAQAALKAIPDARNNNLLKPGWAAQMANTLQQFIDTPANVGYAQTVLLVNTAGSDLTKTGPNGFLGTSNTGDVFKVITDFIHFQPLDIQQSAMKMATPLAAAAADKVAAELAAIQQTRNEQTQATEQAKIAAQRALTQAINPGNGLFFKIGWSTQLANALQQFVNSQTLVNAQIILLENTAGSHPTNSPTQGFLGVGGIDAFVPLTTFVNTYPIATQQDALQQARPQVAAAAEKAAAEQAILATRISQASQFVASAKTALAAAQNPGYYIFFKPNGATQMAAALQQFINDPTVANAQNALYVNLQVSDLTNAGPQGFLSAGFLDDTFYRLTDFVTPPLSTAQLAARDQAVAGAKIAISVAQNPGNAISFKPGGASALVYYLQQFIKYPIIPSAQIVLQANLQYSDLPNTGSNGSLAMGGNAFNALTNFVASALAAY